MIETDHQSLRIDEEVKASPTRAVVEAHPGVNVYKEGLFPSIAEKPLEICHKDDDLLSTLSPSQIWGQRDSFMSTPGKNPDKNTKLQK